MSWLKSTISKVQDKAEALKQSQALKSLQEKTSNVVQRAGDAIASRRGSFTLATEVEAQLEQGARNVKKPAGLSEMHRTWVEQITAAATKPAHYRLEDVERPLGFKEVLLRSRALEITVETIASDPMLRKSYCEPPAAEDKASPVYHLYNLLSKTLTCPTELWTEALKVAMGSDELLADGHVEWLVSIISTMKVDWREELLLSERKAMALRAEHLRQDIKQLESQQGGEDPVAAFKHRVATSTELLQTYHAVRKNLDESHAHRTETMSAKDRNLNRIVEQIQSHMVGLQSAAQSSAEKQRQLEGELQQSHDSVQVQLRSLTAAREEIDRELEALEDKKQRLKMELDDVSRLLDETRMKQRQHMEKCDQSRRDAEVTRTEVAQKIGTESSIVSRSDKERALVERTQRLARQTDDAVQQMLGGQLEDLRKKQGQFKDHFQELLLEHLGHVEAQLRELQSKKDLPEQASSVAEAAVAAEQSFQKFCENYKELLTGPELESRLQRLQAEHASLREQTQAAMPAQEASPTSGGAQAAAAPASPPVATQAPSSGGAPEASPPAAPPVSSAPLAAGYPAGGGAQPAPPPAPASAAPTAPEAASTGAASPASSLPGAVAPPSGGGTQAASPPAATPSAASPPAASAPAASLPAASPPSSTPEPAGTPSSGAPVAAVPAAAETQAAPAPAPAASPPSSAPEAAGAPTSGAPAAQPAPAAPPEAAAAPPSSTAGA